MSTTPAPLDEFARLVRAGERLEAERQHWSAVYQSASKALDDFRVRAAQERIPNYASLLTSFRQDLTRAQAELRRITTERKAVNQRRHLLANDSVQRPDFLDWPLSALLNELRTLQKRESAITKRIMEMVARVDAHGILADSEPLARIRAQAAGSAPEQGTLQPPPKRRVREASA